MLLLHVISFHILEICLNKFKFQRKNKPRLFELGLFCEMDSGHSTHILICFQQDNQEVGTFSCYSI